MAIGLSLAAVLLSTTPAVATAPLPSAPPSVAAQAPTEAEALRLAKAQGRQVEVIGSRTETATVFAMPNGKMRMEQALRPIRAKKPTGEWVGVDANLRRNADGTLSPIASTLPMTFSGGGTGTLASIGAGGRKMSLGWPTSLPVPIVDGSSAVYPEVMPGVDLKITADVDSFNHILVVKSPQAAKLLRRIDYPITTDGLELAPAATGVVIAKDAKGTEQFRGTASMWDTPRKAKPANRPGVKEEPQEPGEAWTRSVGLEVGKGKLSVIPDIAMLESPAERFPLHIDPSWQPTNPGYNSWITVFDRQGGPLYNTPIYASDNPTYGELKIGKTPSAADNYFVARAMFQFNTTGLAWKHVNRAWVTVNQLWSSSWCGDSGTRRTLLMSTGVYNSSTTWYNQPGWMDTYGYSDAKKFVGNSGCPAGPVEFNATGFIQTAANGGWAHATMGLRSANEGDTLGWKRYRLSSLVMTVEYNSYPNAPDDLWVDDKQCAAGQPIYTKDNTPKFVARVTDADPGASLTAAGHWLDGNDNRVVQSGLSNGAYLNQSAASVIPDGTYSYRVASHDGIDWSQWSGNCTFIVDTSGPNTPSSVTSDIYLPKPADFKRGVGRAGNFTFSPPADSSDVYGYRYGLDVSDFTAAKGFVLAGTDKKATVQIVPMEAGDRNLRVWAVDRANNFKAPYEYKFGVARGSGEAAWWTFDGTDPLTDVAAGDNANNLVKSGDTVFTAGRGWTGKALETHGNANAFAATAGRVKGDHPDNPNVVQDFRTDLSYSVAAWVKLDRTGQFQTAVSLDGDRVSAFFLQAAPDRWRFATPLTDVNIPSVAFAQSVAAPVVGKWTHVTGVYDATAKQIRLYVDGKWQSTTGVATVVNATGSVAVGRGIWNDVNGDWLDGKIDDVRLWDRVLSDADVLALAMPLKPGVSLSATSVPFGSSVNATFTAAGADSTVVEYRYQVKGGPVQAVTPPTPGAAATVTLSGLAAGPYDVTVWAKDTVGTLSEFNRADFTVRQAPKVSGNVYDETTGEPAAGVTVTVSPGGYSAVTAADGSYSVTGMPSGTYTVSATIGGRRCGLFASTEVAVPEPVIRDLVMAPQADAFGYTCVEETRPFIDGDDTQRVDLAGDEVTKPLALPFAFPFYGQSYTTVYLSTNGVISFAPIDVVDSENHPVPSVDKPNGAIYPYWTDLLASAFPHSSTITKLITDGGEQAFVIHYHGMRVYDQTPRVSFEVILYQSGKIVVNYTKIDPASELERGNTATVGIESGDGMTGFLYSHNEPVLGDNRAIVFLPPGS